VEATVECMEGDTGNSLGKEPLMTWEAGSYDWPEHHTSVFPPAAAGHVRFVITMQPSRRGGIMYLDDCKLYDWGPALRAGEQLPAPHGYDWARLEVPSLTGEASFTEQRRTYQRQYRPR
jgi:hypothetical protein